MLQVIFGAPDKTDPVVETEIEQRPIRAAASPILDERVPTELTPTIFDRMFGGQRGGNHA